MIERLLIVIKSGQTSHGATSQIISKQISADVSAMYDLNIFDRYLKSGDILFTKDCHILIADLGLARCMPLHFMTTILTNSRLMQWSPVGTSARNCC